MTSEETNEKTLPPPWDRIFSLTTRCFVWALLIAVLYILRPFLLLVFLTFVFAYIQAHGVEGLAHRIKSRPLRVVIVGLVFLGTLFATGFTLLPQVQQQAKDFLSNREKYIAEADKQVNIFLAEYPSLYKALAKHKDNATLLANPSTTNPNTTNPDTTAPDTTAPDTTNPDTTNPATTAPDATTPKSTGEPKQPQPGGTKEENGKPQDQPQDKPGDQATPKDSEQGDPGESGDEARSSQR